MAMGSVVCPGATRNSVISRLPNEMMKPNKAAATTPGLMTGSVTLRKACSGVAPRFNAASSIERSNPPRLAVNSRTVQGIVIMMCARIESGARAQERQLGRELDLDLEHVDGRAGDDARNHQRQEKQRVQRLAPAELPARQYEARGYAENEPADHRRNADLQAGDEPADEIVLVEDVGEPAQRVALRRERHDLVGEESSASRRTGWASG